MGNSNIGNLSKVNSGNVEEFYEINKKEKLGSGATAVVRKAIRKSDGKVVAVKIINKTRLSAEERKVVEAEVEILDRISHPNCVHLYETFETPKKLYLIMELLTGGELFMRIKVKGKFKESVAKESLTHLARALSYLHSLNITHRDLKPENLMYDTNGEDSQLKLTDFGLAAIRPEGAVMHTACGTPAYSAPEILGRADPAYTCSVDIWSLGVILYIMLCSFPPFASPTAAGLYRQIIKGKYDFPAPYWDGVSEAAKDLIGKMLAVDPAKRYTANQVLNHPWITGYYFNELKAIADDVEEWDCKSCTYVNKAEHRACQVCHRSRKGTVSVSPKPAEWTCGLCTFGNAPEKEKCGMCASPKVAAGVGEFFPASPLGAPSAQRPPRVVEEPDHSPIPMSPPVSASPPAASPISVSSPQTPSALVSSSPASSSAPSALSVAVSSPMSQQAYDRVSAVPTSVSSSSSAPFSSAPPSANRISVEKSPAGAKDAGSPAVSGSRTASPAAPKFGVDVFGGMRGAGKQPLMVIEERKTLSGAINPSSPPPSSSASPARKSNASAEGASNSINAARKPMSPAAARKKDKFVKRTQLLTPEQEAEEERAEADKVRLRTQKGGWACPFCRYVNDKSAKKCRMCATMTEIVQEPT